MSPEELNIVMELIDFRNDYFHEKINSDDIFVKDEAQKLKNVFELVRKDNEYIEPTFQKKFLCKLANRLFKFGAITADECQVYRWMFDPYDPWGWIRG